MMIAGQALKDHMMFQKVIWQSLLGQSLEGSSFSSSNYWQITSLQCPYEKLVMTPICGHFAEWRVLTDKVYLFEALLILY